MMDIDDKLRLIGAAKDKILTGPQKVVFLLTNTCNFKCVYCWHHSPLLKARPPYARKKIELPFDAVKRVIDDCYHLNVRNIQLAARGETTLYSRFTELVDYIRRKGLTITLLTNGTFQRSLLSTVLKVDAIDINLATLNPERFKELQSHSSAEMFDSVQTNIRLLLNSKKRRRGKPRLTIVYVLTSQNYLELPEIFAWAYRMGIDYLSVKKMICDKLDPCLGLKYHHLERKAHNMLISLSRTKLFKKIRSNVLDNYSASGEFFDSPPPPSCYNAWYYANITLKGNVTPCALIPDHLIAGNILKKSFKDIWFSKKLMEIRLAGKYGLFGRRCKACRQCLHHRFNLSMHNNVRLLNKARASGASGNKSSVQRSGHRPPRQDDLIHG
ncbi:MAG: radical SAM protein [Candidatus Omnitrophica bacterium]|nr:radical SAM protein [Candidatus Omnitrophota bacterium]MDD5574812.1 radical SAM protein [Candidatus Omnitrophota bacterium]